MSICRFVKVVRDKGITDEKLFSKADANNEGEVDMKALKVCLENLKGLTEKELSQIMTYIDVDGDGTIDRDEFLNSLKNAN